MEKLRQAFYDAYVGEAKAALRLKVYADKAEKEGLPQIARLFRAISLSEEIHGGRTLRLLKAVGDTEANLNASFESETNVAGVAYESFIKLATEAGDEIAARIFSHCRDVEDQHADLYKEAMTHLMEEKETEYHICSVCGYVSDGVLPDICPICGVKKERFVIM